MRIMHEQKSRLTVLLLVVFMAAASSTMAANYVSYAGEFFFAYPEDWVQMDYLTVDAFLQQRGAVDRTLYDYEAVFAHEDNSPFFDGPYLLLKLDTTGTHTRDMIDSVAAELAREYRTQVVHMPFEDFWGKMAFKIPYVDHERGIAGIKLAMGPPREGQRYNIILIQYYDKGAADFFFYAPKEEFDASLDTFKAIFASFSTEDWQSAAAPESLRVADIDTVAKTEEEYVDGITNRVLLIALVGVALSLFVVFRIARRKKRI